MNPRVSRSSALASKATGFPIAKIAARLAVGYTLDEIPNDITRATPASLRAGHRLRRHEDPALGVREAARHDRRARHADAVGRRGDGDRADVPREPAEGAALARAGPPRAQLRSRPRRSWRRSATTSCWRRSPSPTPDRIFQIGELLRRGVTPEAIHDGVPHRPLVPRPDAGDRRGAPPARRRWPDRPSSTPGRGGGPSGSASPTPSWPTCGASPRPTSARRARRPASSRRTRPSTRAPPSSPPRRRTTTRRGRTRTRSARRTGHA